MNLLDNKNGAIAIISLMIISVFALAIITTVSITTSNSLKIANSDIDTEKTFYAAETGINEGLMELNFNPAPHDFCIDFSGVRIDCGDSTFTNKVVVVITAYDKYNRNINSTAMNSAGKIRTLEIEATTSSISVPLKYAVHSGRGGFILDNGAIVRGPVYSNGNIEGDNTSYIYAEYINVDDEVQVASEPTPSPKQESTPQSFNIAQNQENLKAAQQFRVPVEETLNNVSIYIQRSSSQPLPDSPYYLQIVRDNADSPDLTQVVAQEEINIPKDIEWLSIQINPAPILYPDQIYWLVIGATTQVDNSRYIIWHFNDNNDTYADGQAKFFNNTLGTWVSMSGDFSFETLLGIGDTFIKDGYVYGNITAHSIININGEGERNEGINLPRVSYAITDNDIEVWKLDAESGDELDCSLLGPDCTKDANGDVTLNDANPANPEVIDFSVGPKVIRGNLFINGKVNILLLGNLYVEKNIIFMNPGAKMTAGPLNSPAARVVIAEGIIEIKNNAELHGSGHELSYLLMISKDNYSTSGDIAIDPAPNSSSVLFFAPYGFIEMANNTFLNSATAYIIHLENATIEYNENLNDFTVPDSSPDPVIIGTNQRWQEL
ncbi:MAG: hypothetical protein Q8P20_00005 [bacterium]|nr:hypothetical protein [bacterium]